MQNMLNEKEIKYKPINYRSSLTMDIDNAKMTGDGFLWNDLLMLFYCGTKYQEEYTQSYIKRLLEKYY